MTPLEEDLAARIGREIKAEVYRDAGFSPAAAVAAVRAAANVAQAELRNGDVTTEQERGDAFLNPHTLTLEAIKNDPWNAMELPLPANADLALLTAARSAVEYIAEGEYELMRRVREGTYLPPEWSNDGNIQPDAHEYAESRWYAADNRVDEINERIDQLEGRGVYAEGARAPDAPPITNAEYRLYRETLERYPPGTSLYEVLAEQRSESYNVTAHAYPPVDEALRALLPDTGGVPYPWPETFGEALEQIHRGWTARDAVESDMANLPSSDRPGDVARRAAYDESSKRQDSERAARSGEIAPGEAASSEPDSFAADLRAAEKAAKREREGDGQEATKRDHGDTDHAPSTGGGRGFL